MGAEASSRVAPWADVGAQEEAEEEDKEEVGEEAHKPRQVPVPIRPSQADVEEHNVLGHVQYRSWCPHCVASRGVGQRHVAVKEEEGAKPTILSDYGYMNGQSLVDEASGSVDPDNYPILVIKDKKYKYISATYLPDKGVTPFGYKYFSSFIQRMGHQEIIMKSDNEPALVTLKTRAAKEAGVDAIPEESVVGDSKANGEIECAVKEVKGMCRATKSVLEERLGMSLDRRDPMLAWIPTYAADMISRHRVGPDGCTAEKRRTGKNWRRPSFIYGELICFKPAVNKTAQQKKGSFEPVMREGRYLGHHGRTGALLVMTKDGVMKGGGARRMPEEKRWTTEGWSELKGLPWEVQPRQRTVGKSLVSGSDSERTPLLTGPVSVMPAQQRRMYVTSADIEKFSPTDGCPGCTQKALGGTQSVTHNDECRMRIGKLLEESEAGRQRLEQNRRKRRGKEAGPQDAPRLAGDSVGQEGDTKDAKRKKKDAKSEGLAVSPVGPLAEGSSSSSSSSGLKRPSEPTKESEAKLHRSETLNADPSPPMDVEDLVDEPMGDSTAQAGASGTEGDRTLRSADTEMPGVCSLEVVEGSLDPAKAELAGAVSSFVRGCFAAREVDVTSAELRSITTLCIELGSVDVAEIYSPERFTERAANFGLRPGFAVDLQTGWDLLLPEHVEALDVLVENEDPFMLTGSPPCDQFSALLAISKSKRDPKVVEANLAKGRHHLETAVRFYRNQMRRGRYFLHEHPKSAKSWQEPCMVDLVATEGVYKVTGPMCRWQMMATDPRDGQTGHVLKETSWVTNSPVLAAILQGICSNKTGSAPWHRHVHLIGGIAAAAAVYPPALVEGVLKGIRQQMLDDGHISELELHSAGPVCEEPVLDERDYDEFWDSVKGGYLDTSRVHKARDDELAWVERSDLYDVEDRTVCTTEGQTPIDLLWVDTNKGDDGSPEYRSRLVLRDIKARKKKVDRLAVKDLFSCMPPLEALRALLSLKMSMQVSNRGKELKFAIFDISRAHFYGKLERTVFVELPSEIKAKHPGRDVVGRLKKSWYGLQDASHIWQGDYSGLLKDAGYAKGSSNGAIFYNEASDCRVLCHGDDFGVLGDQDAIDEFERVLRSKYEIKKLGNLGFEQGDDKTVRILNRVVSLDGTCQPRTLTYEPDARHAQALVKELGLERANGVETPAEHLSAAVQLENAQAKALSEEKKKLYRSATMKASYLAQDDPGIAEAVKNLARHMNAPNEAHLVALKRLGRFMIKYPMTANVMIEQAMPTKIRAYVDTDHAGCAVTRRSTTGLALTLGRHTTKTQSNMQSTIGLSSGESEWYGLVKGSAAGLGFQSLLRDWGVNLELEVASDSSAARGCAERHGLGQMRHVQTRYLWVQERVAEGHLKVVPIRGKNNPADVLTKAVSGVLRKKHLERLGFHCVAANAQHKALAKSKEGAG